MKFNGNHWNTWHADFINFLNRKNHRWKRILQSISNNSKKPLDGMAYEKIKSDSEIVREEVLEVYKDQLYEYLKAFTSGDTNTLVISNGQANSFETWRRMCDQGKSIRERPLRDERCALFHPKQSTAENLIKAIAEWEKRYADYILQKPEDSMSPEDKIMCLEDLCPEQIQKFLAGQQTLGLLKTYEDYKDAIDRFYYEEKRWNHKKGRGAIDMVGSYSCNEAQCISGCICQGDTGNGDEEEDTSKFVSAIVGEVMALVKGKNFKKGKGKGKTKGGEGKDSGMQVDQSGKGKGKCYECGEEGHIGRDCPIRQSRIAAGGPAIVPGNPNAKGAGKGGKGNGQQVSYQFPTARAWSQMYPGPSLPLWQTWRPQPSAAGKMANLFEAPNQLSVLQQLFQNHQPLQQAFQGLQTVGSAYTLIPKHKSVRAIQIQTKSEVSLHNKFEALSDPTKDCEDKVDGRMQVNIIDLIKPNSKNLKYHKISKKQMIIKAAKLESACVKSSAEIAAKSGPKHDLLT